MQPVLYIYFFISAGENPSSVNWLWSWLVLSKDNSSPLDKEETMSPILHESHGTMSNTALSKISSTRKRVVNARKPFWPAGKDLVAYRIMIVVLLLLGIGSTASDLLLLAGSKTTPIFLVYLCAFICHFYLNVFERMVFVSKNAPPIRWMMGKVYLPWIRFVFSKKKQELPKN